MLEKGEVPYWLVREYLGERGRIQGYQGEQLGHWINEEQNQLKLVDRRSQKEQEREEVRVEAADKAEKKAQLYRLGDLSDLVVALTKEDMRSSGTKTKGRVRIDNLHNKVCDEGRTVHDGIWLECL